MLVPLRAEDLAKAMGAVTIQRVARARGARQRLSPRLPRRLLRLRGAMHVQRWWRSWLMAERVRMLTLVRARTVAVTANKLFLRKSLFEALSGRPPLHAAELWPEHRLRLSFTPPPEAMVNLSMREDAADGAAPPPPRRPGMPAWAAPAVGAAPSDAEPAENMQEPLALLTVGARIAPVDSKKFGGFVHSGWTCVCYQTTSEAARRAALLTMMGYSPMAMRAVHGHHPLSGNQVEPPGLESRRPARRTSPPHRPLYGPSEGSSGRSDTPTGGLSSVETEGSRRGLGRSPPAELPGRRVVVWICSTTGGAAAAVLAGRGGADRGGLRGAGGAARKGGATAAQGAAAAEARRKEGTRAAGAAVGT